MAAAEAEFGASTGTAEQGALPHRATPSAMDRSGTWDGVGLVLRPPE